MSQKKKNSSISSGVTAKHKSYPPEEDNFPIPLVLFTSYVAAEKSDQLIKSFCKELPGILKKINDSKKALKNKTKSMYGLKEDLMIDLKKLELAKLVLKELYNEEETLKQDKEKEIDMLRSQIASNEEARKVMNNALIQYTKSKDALDVVTVETGQYNNAMALIHNYLTLQDMNQKFIGNEYNSATYVKSTDEEVKAQNLLLKHKYEVNMREKQLAILLNKLQVLKNMNYKLTDSMDDILQLRIRDQVARIQTKRWAVDICQKMNVYKENPVYSEDFIKLLGEIQGFIIFARQIILKLQQESNLPK